MLKQKPFPFSLLVLGVLIVLHLVASYHSWYWRYPEFDIVVHMLSGLWVALLILWLASRLDQINSMKEYKLKSFLIALVSAVLVGVLWELLENFGQLASTKALGYGLDTAGDIMSGALGGVIAYLYFIKRKKKIDDTCNVLHPFYNQTGVINTEA